MILFLTDVTLFSPNSGAEQVLFQEAKGLAESGDEVYAITRTNTNNYYHKQIKRNGIIELRYGADTKNVFKFLRHVLKRPNTIYNSYINEDDIEIIICHQPFTLISLLLRKKLKKIPILYLFISPSHQEYLIINRKKAFLLKNIHSYLRKIVERVCLKKAQKVMCLSKYMRRKAIEIHGINEDRFVFNPAGVDLKRFKPIEKRKKIKEKLSFPSGKIHLFTVRNLEIRMGLDNLIKAAHLLKERKLEIHLVIGGEGPEKNNLKHLINYLNLDNQVIMTGFILDEVLPEYYSAADYFILPTRELEGFGLITIESMACGTPVLGTPVGATTEILNDFDSRFLFKDATPEAIAKGIQSVVNEYPLEKDGYTELRGRCRNHIEKNFSWNRHHNKLLSVIHRIVK